MRSYLYAFFSSQSWQTDLVTEAELECLTKRIKVGFLFGGFVDCHKGKTTLNKQAVVASSAPSSFTCFGMLLMLRWFLHPLFVT